MNRPGNPEAVRFESGRLGLTHLLPMIGHFSRRWRDIPDQPSSRLWLNQSTHPKVAHSTASRSSSAWAKYAAAFAQDLVGVAQLAPSCSSAFTFSRSGVVRPSRKRRSRSACRPQWHSVCVVQPILPVIESMVAHCEHDPCGARTPSAPPVLGPLGNTSGSSSWFPRLHPLKRWPSGIPGAVQGLQNF